MQSDKLYGWWLPADFSTHGAEIDRLIWVIHIFMAVLFVGWLGFLLYTLFRFRHRPGAPKPEHHGKHFKLPTYLEVGVIVFEVILLIVFSLPITYKVQKALPPADKALHVRVVAEQFAWNIHYSGQDGVYGRTAPQYIKAGNPVGLDPDDPAGEDDVVTINQLHVPVGVPVIAELSSKDVIHCFALPVMRVKQDVIPGIKVPVWFEATGTGKFEIMCAQLCGLGHYRMRGFFIVETQEEFDKWIADQAAKRAAKKKKAKPAPPAAAVAPPAVTAAATASSTAH